MDTGKFEEILVRTPFAVHRYGGKTYLTFDSIGKILSMLEPVELEALGDEEMKIVIKDNMILLDDPEKAVKLLFKVSQATAWHNQSKGLLFRLKEGEEDGNRNIYQSKGE